jgi:hypothetical protein
MNAACTQGRKVLYMRHLVLQIMHTNTLSGEPQSLFAVAPSDGALGLLSCRLAAACVVGEQSPEQSLPQRKKVSGVVGQSATRLVTVIGAVR